MESRLGTLAQQGWHSTTCCGATPAPKSVFFWGKAFLCDLTHLPHHWRKEGDGRQPRHWMSLCSTSCVSRASFGACSSWVYSPMGALPALRSWVLLLGFVFFNCKFFISPVPVLGLKSQGFKLLLLYHSHSPEMQKQMSVSKCKWFVFMVSVLCWISGWEVWLGHVYLRNFQRGRTFLNRYI